MNDNGRVSPKAPFTVMQKVVAIMIGRGYSYAQAASRLSVARATVKMHAEHAAAKLPGRDAPRMKLQLWWRGADYDIMVGETEER